MAKTSLNHIKYSHLTNFLEFLPKKKKIGLPFSIRIEAQGDQLNPNHYLLQTHAVSTTNSAHTHTSLPVSPL